MAVEPNWLVSLNAPNAYLSLAGFEVTIIGRFWVTAEVIRGRMPFRLAERAPGAHHQLPTEEIQRPSSRNCIGKQSPYTQRFSRASYRRRSNTRLITTLCS